MKIRFLFLLCFIVFNLLGCSSIRILNQPFKGVTNSPVLIVYAENPTELIETRHNGYFGMPDYDTFENWLNNVFESNCDRLLFNLFEPKTVYRFAKRHGVKLLGRPVSTINGIKTLYTFSDSSLPQLFAAADELGASHVVKVRLLKYVRQEYFRTQGSVQGNFTRIDASLLVTAFNIHRPKALFKKIFTVSEDKSDMLGAFLGGGDVKKELATAVINTLLGEESRRSE